MGRETPPVRGRRLISELAGGRDIRELLDPAVINEKQRLDPVAFDKRHYRAHLVIHAMEARSEQVGMHLSGGVIWNIDEVIDASVDRKSTRLNSSPVAISYA